MSDPFIELAGEFRRQMQSIAGASISGIPSELGTITASGLKLDSFKYEITDYLVADWLARIHLPPCSLVGTMTAPVAEDGSPEGGASTSQRTRFDFGETVIDEVRVNWMAGLRPGDRVLAVPVNGGRDAVVICRVVSSGG